MKTIKLVVLLALPWILLPACGGDEPRSRRFIREGGGGGGDGGAAELKAIDAANAGSISGTVQFGGDEIPEMEQISFTDAICEEPHEGAAVYKEFVIVNPNKTLKNCIVYLDVADVYELPTEPALIDQVGCVYTPHVMAMRAGQPFHVKSSDALMHNVHWRSENGNNPEKNFPMRKPGVKEFVMDYTDFDPPLYIKCDVHPWMGAYIGIFDHPFFAVTDETGAFTIEGVPPGSYTLKLWHEKYHAQPLSQNVTVTKGQVTTADYTVTP